MNDSGEPVVDVDTVVRALAVRSRRRVLTELVESADGTVGFEPLARRLALPEQADALGVVVLGLLHRDLPHLEAAGLVEYDSRSETVAATDRIATVEPLLDAARRVERALQSDVPLFDSSD